MVNEVSAKIRGGLFGLAFGDALGAPVEFMSYPSALAAARMTMVGPVARVTDDTQMALAVGEGMLQMGLLHPTVERAEPELRKTFVQWYQSPENNRAPGRTCLRACAALADGHTWLEAVDRNSKGCGANMRVAPVGLAPYSAPLRSALAQFQSALTHGHATALAASDLTAQAANLLLSGTPPGELLEALINYAEQNHETYHHEWLGTLWHRPGIGTAETFIARGFEECIANLKLVSDSLGKFAGEDDACNYTGEGWIAEEALGTALLCFLSIPDDPMEGLRRAVCTGGDSDSIACLAGLLIGCHHGESVWPEQWYEHIEYKEQLEKLAQELSQAY